MSKREASRIALEGIDIDAPRAKRRRETTAAASSPPKVHVATSDTTAAVKNDADGVVGVREDAEAVKEKGLKLWQTVKDAVNKEGRTLSHDFMRLPSKRQYPDYYQQIKRPIALDEIKAQLDAGAYASFDDVKQDFETCFRNAKRYNIKDSQIWKDAKHLHKLATKEYNKMTGAKEEGDGVEDGDDYGGARQGSDDEAGKKKKAPNMNRLLKSRLQKLVEKTDDSGRVLSTMFLELPNKKQWAIYYKTIKRPQCLENIFKHLKRKEYHTTADFANDVELVFSNALEFNQEHTEIWEDALVLRDYFRQLMSDLPPPFAIPAYAPPGEHPKLKLKVPAASGHAPSLPATNIGSSPPNPASSGAILRIPAHQTNTDSATANSPMTIDTTKSSASPPKVPPTPAPPARATPSKPSLTLAPAPPAATPRPLKAPVPTTGTLQPASFTPPIPHSSTYYPNAAYQQPGVPAPMLAPAPATATASTSTSMSPPAAPAPPVSSTPHRPLRSVHLVTRPLGRRLDLDRRDGVRTWVARLGAGESGVRVVAVRFDGEVEEGEESSGEEEEEEEEEEEAPKRRGRGRQKKRAHVKAEKGKSKGKAPVRAVPAPPEVQVKLNGVLVKEEEGKAEWDFELPMGVNILEVGEKGALPWRAYIERVSV